MNVQFPVIFSWCLLSTQVVAALAPAAVADPTSLWAHVGGVADLGELRSMAARWEGHAGGGILQLATREDPPALSPSSIVPSHLPPYAWVVIPPPPGGWKLARPMALEVRGLVATGEVAAWARPPGRLVVPDVEDRAPAPGRRVRYRLPGDEETGIYGVLQLPNDWRPGGRYPVIVEYPGNSYYVKDCYSTGLPDQCTMGFGMTKAQGAICLGLPFVDRRAGALPKAAGATPTTRPPTRCGWLTRCARSSVAIG